MTSLRVEPTLHKSHGPCPHCGGEEQTVWGNVYGAGQQRAVYYVRWTAGQRRENITFLVSVGSWSDSAPGDRRSVGLACYGIPKRRWRQFWRRDTLVKPSARPA